MNARPAPAQTRGIGISQRGFATTKGIQIRLVLVLVIVLMWPEKSGHGSLQKGEPRSEEETIQH